MTNSKEILANNIKNLLKMQGFSREMVAEGIGVKYTTFCDWAKGRTYPKMEYIKEIADFFCVTLNGLLEENPDYEMCMELYRQEHEPKGMFTQYFVYEINKLHSTPNDLKLLYSADVPYQWDSENQTFMGLILNDDSMSPKYLKNDIVIVTEQESLSGDGDYIIQLLKNSGAKTYFRRIKIIDDSIAIIPLNPLNEIKDVTKHIPINDFKNKYKVLGKMKRHIRDFD